MLHRFGSNVSLLAHIILFIIYAPRTITVLSLSSDPSSGANKNSAEKKLQQKNQKWTPKIASLAERRKLRGQVHNSETIGSIGFHHVEFYCGDAVSTAQRLRLALGMRQTGLTGQSTGNDQCVSYQLESGDVRFLVTAPYSQAIATNTNTKSGTKKQVGEEEAPNPLPSFDPKEAHDFFRMHGLAAKAIGLEVKDATKAFENAVAKGATPILEPVFVEACDGQKKSGEASASGGCHISEVRLYGDVVLRFISFLDLKKNDTNRLLPNLKPYHDKRKDSYGIFRLDHAVGNVPNLLETQQYVEKALGFHDFAEFTSEDVGTVDSGLNSVVMASDTEDVLLPLNEPVSRTRKSQIQTFLEQNEGSGLQHLALKTKDIFETIEKMRLAEEELGGFELMKRPSNEYYRELPSRLGDKLTAEQYRRLEELGILADADDEGVLLQVFTKPIGDRPTFFFEIIQRIGCRYVPEGADLEMERPGCGGFGQGNFRELFKAIEEHEKTLKI